MDSHDVTFELVDGVDHSCLNLWHKSFMIGLILDVLLAWCSWTEFNYHNAKKVTAKFTFVGKSEHYSRRCGHRVLHRLRYVFTDTHSGRRHQNTVEIDPQLVPTGQTVQVQWIPGEMPESRLAMQAKPWVTTVFVVFNSILFIAAGIFIVQIAKEVNGHPLTRQQRWIQERRPLAAR